MSTESLAPDILISANGFGSCALGDLTGRDAAWCVASGNNVSDDLHVSFPLPTDDLTLGAGLQTIEVEVRQFDTGQTGVPTARIELWEAGGGAALATSSALSVTGAAQIISLAFNASLLADISGAAVEVKVFGAKIGGSGSKRNSVDIGEVRWIADYTLPPATGPDLLLGMTGA